MELRDDDPMVLALLAVAPLRVRVQPQLGRPVRALQVRALRVRAAGHELRCRECRVTWKSWAGRLVGDRRAYRPLDYRVRRAAR